MTRCPQCHTLNLDFAAECNQCGHGISFAPSPSSKSVNLIRNYFQSVTEILSKPSAFFSRMPVSGGWSGPLAFALVTHWIGSAFQYLILLLSGDALSRSFKPLLDFANYFANDIVDVDDPGYSRKGQMLLEMKDQVIHWIWGAGSVMVDPFLTLLSIFFTTFFVYLGARLLVSENRSALRFETALRIICFGMTPSLFRALPIAGGILSHLFTAMITIIGAREVYRISTTRSVFIVFFPQLLLMAAFLGGLLLLGVIFYQMFQTFFF